jgi:hypothetical protein
MPRSRVDNPTVTLHERRIDVVRREQQAERAAAEEAARKRASRDKATELARRWWDKVSHHLVADVLACTPSGRRKVARMRAKARRKRLAAAPRDHHGRIIWSEVDSRRKTNRAAGKPKP